MGIIRIVKLTFDEGKVKDFIEIYESSNHVIRSFEGCTHLELLKDYHHNHVFYTYSKWESNDYLEKYRHSELFITTWQKTKLLFQAKPQVFTMEAFI